MMERVREKVFEIIAEQAVLNVSDIDIDGPLADLGIDSLGLVEAMFAIEEAFDVQVPFNGNAVDEGIDLTSVGAMIAGVQRLVAQK